MKCSVSELTNEKIDSGAFNIKGMPSSNIVTIDLHGNKITKINDLWFSKLVHLKMLYLSRNKLVDIYDTSFLSLENLEQLHLQGNQISKFSIDINNYKKLIELDISDNMLTDLGMDIFENFVSDDNSESVKRDLYISENSLKCKCPIIGLTEKISKMNNINIHSSKQKCIMVDRLEPFSVVCLINIDDKLCYLEDKQKLMITSHCAGFFIYKIIFNISYPSISNQLNISYS